MHVQALVTVRPDEPRPRVVGKLGAVRGAHDRVLAGHPRTVALEAAVPLRRVGGHGGLQEPQRAAVGRDAQQPPVGRRGPLASPAVAPPEDGDRPWVHVDTLPTEARRLDLLGLLVILELAAVGGVGRRQRTAAPRALAAQAAVVDRGRRDREGLEAQGPADARDSQPLAAVVGPEHLVHAARRAAPQARLGAREHVQALASALGAEQLAPVINLELGATRRPLGREAARPPRAPAAQAPCAVADERESGVVPEDWTEAEKRQGADVRDHVECSPHSIRALELQPGAMARLALHRGRHPHAAGLAPLQLGHAPAHATVDRDAGQRVGVVAAAGANPLVEG
mmetsp:Transcript_97151/g.302479  ORF Transcript_97151/g.302479 Transcript_97151/m.302479 type:complete len:340 (-) Transcript_97151:1528-2547(-)